MSKYQEDNLQSGAQETEQPTVQSANRKLIEKTAALKIAVLKMAELEALHEAEKTKIETTNKIIEAFCMGVREKFCIEAQKQEYK